MPASAAIVGGGIIGCAIAHDLAKAGCRVTLYERATPGAEASSAAAGLLAPLGHSSHLDPFHELTVMSWRLYPAVAAELYDLTAIEVEYMTGGTLYPILDSHEAASARARAASPMAREFGIEIVEGDDLHVIEPALAKDIERALLVAGDHWVNNQRLVAAYAAAAARRGVAIRSGADVSRIAVEGGRATGVVVDGQREAADHVVVAAGAWSGALLAGIGADLPVGPVRGQMLAVSSSPPFLSHAVYGAGVYLVPRPSGELLIGATVEDAGFLRAVTPDGLAELIGGAVRIAPEIGGRAVLRTWCGFRPWAPDDLPVLGPWPGVAGLHVATGHYRNGILLAPITARLITECVMTGQVPSELAPFLPDRFLAKEP